MSAAAAIRWRARLVWGEFMWLVKLRTVCLVAGHRWGQWFDWYSGPFVPPDTPPNVRSRSCERCGDCQHIDL